MYKSHPEYWSQWCLTLTVGQSVCFEVALENTLRCAGDGWSSPCLGNYHLCFAALNFEATLVEVKNVLIWLLINLNLNFRDILKWQVGYRIIRGWCIYWIFGYFVFILIFIITCKKHERYSSRDGSILILLQR